MIITTQYILLFSLAIFLTVFAWFIDANWIKKRYGADHFKSLRTVAIWLLVILIIWLCVLNFPVTLTTLVFACGLIVLIDQLFIRRRVSAYQQPVIVENARSFFWVLLVVWVIRSFIIQPYRVPTGSLQPTVKPGDFILVNQYAYGLHFPIGNAKFLNVGEPKRGDIVLFYAPPNPSIVLVKRVVGLPGDHVEYRNKVLYINGKEMPQTLLGKAIDDEPAMGAMPEEHIPVDVKEENLDGVIHKIFIASDTPGLNEDIDVQVPPDHYFMMGDNRDNSDDSRTWGFAPAHYLIGKAILTWMSWDAIKNEIRWDRIGQVVK